MATVDEPCAVFNTEVSRKGKNNTHAAPMRDRLVKMVADLRCRQNSAERAAHTDDNEACRRPFRRRILQYFVNSRFSAQPRLHAQRQQHAY